MFDEALMKIAHFSDLHMLALGGVPASRFFNKRFTGWVNLRYKRGSVHRAEYVRAIAREIARIEPDHVVVTGDLTNLALETEFEVARQLFEDELGLDPSRVTIVPGNHDLYTRGSLLSRRFERYFAPWLESDVSEGASGTRFPVVKLRGSVAIVALSSATPRLPLVAAGELGPEQLEALNRVLHHPEVARRTLVLALHHPAVHDWSPLKKHLEGLRDAPALLKLLRPLERGLLLHGHLHRRLHRVLPTSSGEVHQVGATSASLHHEAPDRMAGFNVYELDEDGVESVQAAVYEPSTGKFHVASIPKY
jgi:3',5'-cyclic AMP phosphodiesterase CpdA